MGRVLRCKEILPKIKVEINLYATDFCHCFVLQHWFCWSLFFSQHWCHYFTVIVLLAVFRNPNVIGLIPSKLVSLVVVWATLVLLVLFNTGGFGRFFCIKGVIDCFLHHWRCWCFLYNTDVVGHFSFGTAVVGCFLQHFCFGRPRPAPPSLSLSAEIQRPAKQLLCPSLTPSRFSVSPSSNKQQLNKHQQHRCFVRTSRHPRFCPKFPWFCYCGLLSSSHHECQREHGHAKTSPKTGTCFTS